MSNYNNIELVRTIDPAKTGHLFCGDCAEELNVVTPLNDLFANPRYMITWDTPWHQFHNVRHVFPKTLKMLLEDNTLESLVCPCCTTKGKITIMNNGLFDVKLLHRSLQNKPALYTCVMCEGKFASDKCVTKVSDTHDMYVCGDCASAV